MAGTTTETITYEGMDTLQAFIKAVPGRAMGYLKQEVYLVVTEAFNESQKEVPVATGMLRGSGDVGIDTSSDAQLIVYIGYGGPSASYALSVHENLAAHHAPPTKAKYLEDPVNRALTRMPSRMQADIEGALLGNLPGAPNMEEAGQAAARAKEETRLRARISRARAGMHPHPMSDAEIHRALQTIDKGRALERQGKRGIRRYYRSTE